ncbi:MAG: hypothetical protein WB683_06190 [Candidatus Sulfotelmatobacter sp.]
MTGAIKRAILAISAIVLALAVPATAQLEVGENTSLRLNGNLQVGYSGDYSNVTPSDHSLTPGGNADLSGYYYNPNFLSFDAQTYYNQSRLNSTEQSVFQTTGFAGSASLFSGSHYAGSIGYSKTLDSEGGYTLPGAGSLTTKGNTQNVFLTWGLHFPGLPQVQFHFNDGDSENSLLGSDENSTSHTKIFGVQVTHKLEGFNLTGSYDHSTANELVPDLVTGGEPQTSDSSTNSFNVGASHKLPMRGEFDVTYSRSDMNANYSGGDYNGSVDTVTAGAGFNPFKKLNVSVNTQYTDNLSGSAFQPLVTSGAAVPPSLLSYATKSFTVTGQQSYSIGNFIQNLNLVATETHQEQTVLGESFSGNTFSQMVNYGRPVFGGFMNATASISENMVAFSQDQTSIGTYENISYTRGLDGWELNVSGNYSRSIETALLEYTNSGDGYSASISRKFDSGIFWNIVANGEKVQYDQVNTAGSYAQIYSTSLSIRQCGVSGSFSKSSGNSILTPTGLVASPLPVPTADALLLKGDSYSASVFANPTHGMLLSASYVRAVDDIFGNSTASRNSNGQLIVQFQHKFRQLWLQGGYFKLNQAISVSGQPPLMSGSFYIGISRWFNFF